MDRFYRYILRVCKGSSSNGNLSIVFEANSGHGLSIPADLHDNDAKLVSFTEYIMLSCSCGNVD